MSRIAIFLCLIVLTAVGFSLTHGSQVVTTGVSAGDQDSESVDQAAHVRAAPQHEMFGSRLRVGDKSVKILDVLWGSSSQDTLGPAWIRYETEDGQIVEQDHTATYKTVFAQPSDIKRTYLLFGSTDGNKLWLESITFAQTDSGFLTPTSFTGLDGTGSLVSYRTDALPLVCQFVGQLTCTQGTCAGDCPAEPPCRCTTTGVCNSALVQVCPGTGQCAGATTCQISGTSCGCY